MYGLRFRETLPQAVADEMDGLIAAIRNIFYKEHSEDGSHLDAAPEAALVPVGSIIGWSTATAPDRWLLCDGAAVSRITYKELFKVIGITYGAGDGVLTFGTPNLKGRFPLGKAASGTGSTLGAVGGSIDHTHAGPSHSHTVNGHTHSIGSGGGHSHTGTNWSASVESGFDTQSGTGATRTDTHSHTVSGTTSSDGSHDHGGATGSQSPGTDSAGTGNTGASNPPFLVLSYIIFAGG